MITSAEGCQRSDDVVITVLPFIEPTINIRNLITANNDGYNDFWMITGIEDFPETEVKVFNIYGQLLYESMDYQNDWDGTFKGNKLPNGTYYYSVKLREVEELIKGTLTILGNE
jgi:gliding motility-associated-like protein